MRITPNAKVIVVGAFAAAALIGSGVAFASSSAPPGAARSTPVTGAEPQAPAAPAPTPPPATKDVPPGEPSVPPSEHVVRTAPAPAPGLDGPAPAPSPTPAAPRLIDTEAVQWIEVPVGVGLPTTPTIVRSRDDVRRYLNGAALPGWVDTFAFDRFVLVLVQGGSGDACNSGGIAEPSVERVGATLHVRGAMVSTTMLCLEDAPPPATKWIMALPVDAALADGATDATFVVGP